MNMNVQGVDLVHQAKREEEEVFNNFFACTVIGVFAECVYLL